MTKRSGRPLRSWMRAAVVTAMVASMSGAPLDAALPQRSQNADAALAAEFQKRVREYADQREKFKETLPTLTDQSPPEDIDQHKAALERLITRARAGAKRGDIFTQPIRAYFRRQLARVFSGPDGERSRRTIMDENPRTIRLRVNSRYPDGAVLTNMPPQVLLLLPSLPPQMEYRFVGEDLVLLDLESAMVVDYVDDAIDK
jgi:hypothetical protein